MLRGREAANSGNYDYAIRIFRDVLYADPGHRMGHIALRGCELEKFRARGGGLKAKVEAFFKGIGPLLTILLFRKKPEKVAQACEAFLVNDPTNIYVLVSLASALGQLGHLEAAGDTLEFARQRKPKHMGVLRLLGEVLYEQGQYDKAVRCYQEIVAIQPEDREAAARGRTISAESHLKRSKMEQSQSYREVLRDDTKARTLEEEGRVLRGPDALDQEIAKLQKAVEENTEDPDRHQRLGDAHFRAEQYAEAEVSYRRAFDIGKKWPAREKMGDARLRLLEQAERALAKEAEESGNDPARVGRAREAQLKRLEFAIKEFEFRRQQHPTDTKLCWQLGLYYMELGGAPNIQRAIQQFQHAMTNASFKLSAQLMLGRCFAADPKTLDMARDQLSKAYESVQDDASEMGKTLLYEMGTVCEKMGNPSDALTAYKKIFAVDAGYRDVAKKIQQLG